MPGVRTWPGVGDQGGRTPGRGCTPVVSRPLGTRRPVLPAALPAPAGQALGKAVGSAGAPTHPGPQAVFL